MPKKHSQLWKACIKVFQVSTCGWRMFGRNPSRQVVALLSLITILTTGLHGHCSTIITIFVMSINAVHGLLWHFFISMIHFYSIPVSCRPCPLGTSRWELERLENLFVQFFLFCKMTQSQILKMLAESTDL